MINLKVDLDNKVYPLFIGHDILARFGEICQLYGYKSRAMLITDSNLKDSSHFKIVWDNFARLDIEIIPLFLKSAPQTGDGLATFQQVAERLVKHHFKSDETIISLGGSYIGNIAAFISKVIYGGVSYIQIPSTLSAQVFQSINPICYLNAGSLFNFCSLKYERNLVWIDVSLLTSLPQKSILNGLGYVIQSACLLNNGLFEFLETNLKEILSLKPGIIEQTVIHSCQNSILLFQQGKAGQQNRGLPNFGESVAALLIESAPKRINSGAALLIGMLVEGIIAFRQGIFSSTQFERFYQLLKAIAFYDLIDPIDQVRWIESLKDEISHYQLLSFSLPQEFGKFTSATECKKSDLISAIELVFSH